MFYYFFALFFFKNLAPAITIIVKEELEKERVRLG